MFVVADTTIRVGNDIAATTLRIPFQPTQQKAMIDPKSLGALSGIHELLLQLVEGLPARDCARRFEPNLPSPAWLLGRAVYLELFLLREQVMGDDDLAGRVRHLFADDRQPANSIDAELPPQDHLLSWAHEIFDQHLVWLANPGHVPEHAWLADSWLVWHLAQRGALIYERMLAVMTARSARRDRGDHRVETPLQARLPQADTVRIEQGHYRIGARDGAVMPNERPAQVVELNAFRIARRPVCNAEFLAFVEGGGYQDPAWWDDAGHGWLTEQAVGAPWAWRRDAAGNWYEVGLNGVMDLHPDAALAGINAHEARAYATWAAANGDDLAGAVPQHEYQWEVAARLGELTMTGRSWEWCANELQPYAAYQQPSDPILEPCLEDPGAVALRGGCLHTQPSIRRSTFRHCARPEERHLFAGLRLVLPAGKAAWE